MTERAYFMNISFGRIGEEKALRIRNLIMREAGAESVSIYFDVPIEDQNSSEGQDI